MKITWTNVGLALAGLAGLAGLACWVLVWLLVYWGYR